MPSTSSSPASCLSLRKVFYLGGHSRPHELYGAVHARTSPTHRSSVLKISPGPTGMLLDQGKVRVTKLIKEGEAGVGVEYALDGKSRTAHDSLVITSVCLLLASLGVRTLC